MNKNNFEPLDLDTSKILRYTPETLNKYIYWS